MNIKKLVLFGLAISLGTGVFAQKSNIRKASRALDDANTATTNKDEGKALLSLNQAKAAIDSAVVNPKTKDDPSAWLKKATIYISLQGNSLHAGLPYLESYEALNKAFELDDKYKDKPEALPVIMRTAFYAFNDGVSSFNKSKYEDALKSLSKTLELLGQEEDKRFSGHQDVDTIRAQAMMISGYSAFYSNKYDKAISMLKKCTESPYLSGNQSNVYLLLAQAYERKGDSKNQLTTIVAGEKKYPQDDNLRNAEINYYLASGNTDELVKKFKEGTEKDPNNAQNYFNLGILYDQMANPKDGSTPANKEEYVGKANKALNKAIELAPENAQMKYQMAAHYYNQAAEVNNVMSNMSADNMTKYKDLEKQRDAFFQKALPLFEKCKSMYQPKTSKLSGEDRKFYVQTLEALAKIYAIQNKMDKAKENQELLNKL